MRSNLLNPIKDEDENRNVSIFRRGYVTRGISYVAGILFVFS